VRIDWQLGLRIDHILAQPVPRLHQRIQIISTWVHFDPSGVIFRSRRLSEAHCLQSTFLIDLSVTPYPVCPHVCAVEVGFRRIKYHAVDSGLLAVFKVLDVLFNVTGCVDREDVPVPGVIVKGVAVYGVRWFLSRKEEDGAGLGVGVVCFGCRSVSAMG
jgi:hypothetical protein